MQTTDKICDSDNHLKIIKVLDYVLSGGFPVYLCTLTGRSAVTAHVVSRHPLDLSQNGFRQLLHDVVLTDMLVPFKGLIQRLLFTVL